MSRLSRWRAVALVIAAATLVAPAGAQAAGAESPAGAVARATEAISAKVTPEFVADLRARAIAAAEDAGVAYDAPSVASMREELLATLALSVTPEAVAAASAAAEKDDPIGDLLNDNGDDYTDSEDQAGSVCRLFKYTKYTGWRFAPVYTTVWHAGAFYNCSTGGQEFVPTVCGFFGLDTAVHKKVFSLGVGASWLDACPFVPILKAKIGSKPNLLVGIHFYWSSTGWDVIPYVKVR